MRVDFRRAPALREGERRGQTAANEGGTAPAVQKQGLQSVPRILPKGTRFLFCKASGEAFAGIPPPLDFRFHQIVRKINVLKATPLRITGF